MLSTIHQFFVRMWSGTVATFGAIVHFGSAIAHGWRTYANRFSLAIIIVVGGSLFYVYHTAIQAPDDFPAGELVSVPSGVGASGIAEALKEEHVIRSTTAFRIAAVLLGHERAMQAGDYLFKQPVSVWSIARAVSLGAHGLEPMKFLVKEGMSSRQMARLFSVLPHFDQRLFLQRIDDENLEGYLFPDTYYFLPNANENTIIDTMEGNFTCRVCAGVACVHAAGSSTLVMVPSNCTVTQEASTTATLIAKSGRSLDEIVTMASILEKEGIGKDNDYRKIAGVLWNRITKDMPLAVDAAFLYSIGKSTHTLTMSDLRNSDDPYNTYKHTGLPPTAIGSPSLDSIVAAATPIKSKNLFYLSDKNGNTYYSPTYAKHSELKALYIDSQK